MYERLTVPILKAIQNQQKNIQNQQSEIDALKLRLEKIEEFINTNTEE